MNIIPRSALPASDTPPAISVPLVNRALNPFKAICIACKIVTDTHDPSFTGIRFYLAKDFSPTKDPGKMATITELLLEFQSRIHQFKPVPQSAKEAIDSIDNIIKCLHNISEFGQQKKVFGFHNIFNGLIRDTVRHVYARSKNLEVKKVAGPIQINFFKTFPPPLSLITTYKELVHICSRFVRTAIVAHDSWKKREFRIQIFYNKLDKVNQLIDAKALPPPVNITSPEAMSLLIRYFNKAEASTNLVIPKKVLNNDERAKMELILQNPKVDVQQIVQRLLSCSAELKKLMIFGNDLAGLRSGVEALKKTQKAKVKILLPIKALWEFLSKNIRVLNKSPTEATVKFAHSLKEFLTTEFTETVERTMNAYYSYLYFDLDWDLSKKKQILTPKREAASLLKLTDQSHLFEPTLIEKITISNNESTDIIENTETQMQMIAQVIRESSVPFQMEAKRAGTSKTTQLPSNEADVKGLVDSASAAASALSPAVQAVSIYDQIRANRFFKDGVKYSGLLKKWFTDPEAALAHPKYSALPTLVKEKVRLLHTFPLCVDNFIGSIYSHKSTWKDPKTGEEFPLFLIPVEVRIGDDSFFAVVEYTFDKNWTCFHRCISEKQVDDFYITWRNFDFPSLEESKKAAAETAEIVVMDESGIKISQEPLFEFFIIEATNITLKLMKVEI